MTATSRGAHSPSSIILAQLGGGQFMAMTGAHTIVSNDGSKADPNPWVQMILGAHEAGWHKLRITLMSNGLYKMEFWKPAALAMLVAQEAGPLDPREAQEFTHVYNDQLQSIFTEVTGMDTRLF